MDLLMVTARLLEGFLLNCKLFVLTLALALPLGLAIAFGSMSRWKPLRFLQGLCRLPRVARSRVLWRLLLVVGAFRPIRAVTRLFVWIIRGTPLLLQVIIVFYGPGLLWNASGFSRFNAALIAFIINYACYFSEIYRGGIEGIPQGQYEAGQVLGMTRGQIFSRVILLQVLKRIVYPMSNEVITLVKDTSLARIIANKEILMMAQDYIATYAIIWPLFYSGVFFLFFNGLLTILFDCAERKLSFFRV